MKSVEVVWLRFINGWCWWDVISWGPAISIPKGLMKVSDFGVNYEVSDFLLSTFQISFQFFLVSSSKLYNSRANIFSFSYKKKKTDWPWPAGVRFRARNLRCHHRTPQGEREIFHAQHEVRFHIFRNDHNKYNWLFSTSKFFFTDAWNIA